MLRPSLLALAAIAASLALLAAMVVTDILGAIHADLGRGLLADTAHEGSGFAHDSYSCFALVFLLAGAAAGRAGCRF